MLFFLFLIPPPSEFLYIVGGVMANFNTQASYLILKSVGLPVTLISSYGPPVISFVTSTQEPLSFAVDLSCSGIYSLIAFAMFATFLALIIQSSILKKIGLFVAGFLVFEILNVLRLTIIVLAGYWFGEEVALLVFHTATGFLLIFVGMLLILLIAEKVWRIEVVPTSAKPLSCPACRKAAKKVEDFCLSCGKVFSSYQTKLSKRFWTKLFLLLVGVSIAALSIQAPTFAIAREAIEVTSGWETGANILPPTINITDLQDESYTLSFLYRDEAYERQTNQEASLTYAYFPENKSQVSVYVTVGVAKSVSNLHSWEVCLITWQTAWGQYPLVSVLDSSDVELLGDVPLIARYLVFERPEDYIQMTLYWYERAAFKTGLTVEQRYVRISLIILLRESAEYKGLKDQLISFGQYIASYWRPFENQALVSLGVPTLQLLLIVSSAFLVLTKLGSGLNEQRRKTGNLKIFRTSAPPQERLMLQSILDLAKKKGEMETREILDAVKENVKESTNFEELQRMLKRLEEYGFVTRDVVSVENKPKQVWKTKVHEL
ncbi:MAG: exosortase/archaeosortase family protein [Promethearchaeota archaeon]